jgi:hypothetical protein
VVLVADWSAEGVVLAEAEGVVLEAPAVADWSADGVEAEAEPAGVVAEAEAEGEALLEAVWLLLSVVAGVEAGGGGAVVLPVPEAEAAVVSAVGCAPLLVLLAEGAAALVLACPEADWSEFGMLLAEAEGAAALEGAAPLAVVVVVVVVSVAAAPEAGAAAEAPVVLQESETGFMSETLNLLSEPIEPVAEICLPTCPSSPLPSSL